MLSLEQRRTAGVYFQNSNGMCSVARITEKRLKTWVSRCSGRAAAPNPGTRRGVRSPLRQADPEAGAATHCPLCEAKLKKQGALAEKTLGKARGVDTHPPRAPGACNQAITSMRDERPAPKPPASPTRSTGRCGRPGHSPSTPRRARRPRCPRTGGYAEPPAPGAPRRSSSATPRPGSGTCPRAAGCRARSSTSVRGEHSPPPTSGRSRSRAGPDPRCP